MEKEVKGNRVRKDMGRRVSIEKAKMDGGRWLQWREAEWSLLVSTASPVLFACCWLFICCLRLFRCLCLYLYSISSSRYRFLCLLGCIRHELSLYLPDSVSTSLCSSLCIILSPWPLTSLVLHLCLYLPVYNSSTLLSLSTYVSLFLTM